MNEKDEEMEKLKDELKSFVIKCFENLQKQIDEIKDKLKEKELDLSGNSKS